MKIGKYTIQSVNTGYFGLDGGAMFGIIPKPLWEKTNPADAQNRVLLSASPLLLISENKKILIDTGMGDKWDEKARNIYNIQSDSTLQNSLSEYDISPDEITDVLLTHLHFDHAGGGTKYNDGKILPTFQNAKYYVQKKNFDWAMNPTDRDKGSYIKENYIPLFKEGVLNLINEDFQFDDNISSIVINGHTFGQQMIKISDSSQTLLFCGDLLPFSSHVHLPYIMGYDLQPLVTLEEKKKILSQASDEEWKLYFEHDPYTQCVQVQLGEKGFTIKKKYDSIND